MKQTTGRWIVKTFGFYFAAFALAVLVWWTESRMQSGPTIYVEIPIQQAAVSAFSDMNRLLITLGTSLLGAMGLLLSGGLKGKSCARELWAASAGGVSVALSIYYGYAANLAVISMVAGGSFDPYSPMLMRIHSAHFITFIAGVILFGGFIYKNMIAEGEDEDSDHVVGS
jgi:hypothetical protein